MIPIASSSYQRGKEAAGAVAESREAQPYAKIPSVTAQAPHRAGWERAAPALSQGAFQAKRPQRWHICLRGAAGARNHSGGCDLDCKSHPSCKSTPSRLVLSAAKFPWDDFLVFRVSAGAVVRL